MLAGGLFAQGDAEAPNIEYYNFDTGKRREIVRFNKSTLTGERNTVAVAPDDRWILYLQWDRFDSAS